MKHPNHRNDGKLHRKELGNRLQRDSASYKQKEILRVLEILETSAITAITCLFPPMVQVTLPRVNSSNRHRRRSCCTCCMICMSQIAKPLRRPWTRFQVKQNRGKFCCRRCHMLCLLCVNTCCEGFKNMFKRS